jgi:hypothetical protein
VTFPSFVILCRSPLSEASGVALLLAGIACLYAYALNGRAVVGAIGAWLLGISTCVRVANLLFAPAILLAVIAATRTWTTRLKALGALSSAVLAGIAPLLVFNWHYLGGPLRSGYAIWVLDGGKPREPFKFEYLGMNLGALWRELTQHERDYTTANLFDGGSYFGPALAALASIAALRSFKAPAARAISVSALGYAGIMLFYFHKDPRFMYPVLLVALPGIAVWATDIIGAAGRRAPRSVAGAAAAALLVAAAVAGVPGHKQIPDLRGLLEFKPSVSARSYATAIQDLKTVVQDGEWLALTDLHPALVYALTDGTRVVTPLGPRSPLNLWQFTEEERMRLIRTSLEHGRVYALIVEHAIADVDGLCPPPAGYQWRSVLVRSPMMGIFRLDPAESRR